MITSAEKTREFSALSNEQRYAIINNRLLLGIDVTRGCHYGFPDKRAMLLQYANTIDK